MEQRDFFDLLPDLTLDEVFDAYLDCRKQKRRSLSSLRFERQYERRLMQLHKEITRRKYRTNPSKAFIVRHPVQREVFAADFRDRIVHHLIMGRLMPIFEKVFSDASYSCRAGKGTLYGILDCAEMMKRCSNAYTSDCYVLRLDIHGFFFHIDKDILYQKIKNLVDKEFFNTAKSSILYMIEEVLRDNPTHNCKIRGSRDDWTGLPKTKSLFYSGSHKGLPIGNLTSQIFANFYLNDFDHYVVGLDKDIFYGRYVDDIVIMHPSRDYLLEVKQKVATYLADELGLELHPKKVSLQHFAKGFAFIGAYIKPGRIYPGKRLRASFYRRVYALNAEWERAKKVDRFLIEKTVSSLNSYFGLLKHFDAWRVKLKGWNRLSDKIRSVLHTDQDLKKVWLDKKTKRQMMDEARRIFTEPMRPKKKYRKMMKKETHPG